MLEDDKSDNKEEKECIATGVQDIDDYLSLDRLKLSKLQIEVNYWQYLYNIQINALYFSIGNYVSQDLASELKNIDSRLRIKLCMNSIILGMDKYFAEIANYPKGYGDSFKVYIEKYYPNYLLHYITSTKGNR